MYFGYNCTSSRRSGIVETFKKRVTHNNVAIKTLCDGCKHSRLCDINLWIIDTQKFKKSLCDR